MDSPSHSRPLQIFFLPYLSPGHFIPLSEMARLFAARGEHVTIITTPSNSLLLDNFISQDTAAGRRIGVHTIPFPSAEVGLPGGLENFFAANDIDTAAKLYKGLTLMQSHIESFILSHPPDCLVADMFYPWTTALAHRLNIPRLVFHSACIFAMCMKHSMSLADSPHHFVSSDYEPFVAPNLPHSITITRAQLPDYVRTPNGYTQLMEQWREAELKSFGVLVNNFEELEVEYIEHYKNIMGHTVWHIGPAPLILKNSDDKVKRSHETVVGAADCLSWLDSKEPDSVLYICFGSACRFPDDQLFELACALEASGRQFIWVVFGKEEEKEEEERQKWMPKGFEERMKHEDKGMIIRGWAPQVLILDHPTIGGFMTHCGWNSVVEGICAGIPMITWPLYAEQFYNEKLITQVLKIGVEAGVENWNLWVNAGKKVVKRERIENAIKTLMDDGEEAIERRRHAQEMGKVANKATKEGGSSHNNLTILIQDLNNIKNKK